MIRTLLAVSAALAIVVFCGALVTADSKAVTADSVVLQVDAPRIDGAVQFSTPSTPSWSWRCTRLSCKVGAARGTIFTIVAEDGATSRFVSWEGACGSNGAGNTCTVAANTDLTYVKAQYSRPRLRLSAFGAGKIEVESAKPGYPPPPWWSCGTNCREYEYGEPLRLRAVRADSSFRMTGWDGACRRVPANYNCLLTMRENYFVAATFEQPPPASKSDCKPNKDCGPATSLLRFTVIVNGRGMVWAAKKWGLEKLYCRSVSCPLFRFQDNSVELTANEIYDRSFRGWSGDLCGKFGKQPKCKFYYKRNDPRKKEIRALFDS